ncbi:MAG: histidine--tRNA ligase [Candidatus Marinimicrobia bacterium]|nr:histidine--tRNA ligase [Candidatus Neomarinimicrobiota bacterium]
MSQSVPRVKGVRDILPDETPVWRFLEQKIHAQAAAFGYREIRTPTFEATELFVRSVGSETDIVNKEMYSFTDQAGKGLTLKPELTAPVIRAYIQNNLHREAPLTRLYYIDALYRQERPQKGRLRQFHQFGAEAIGSPYPEQDIEIITLAYDICSAFCSDLTVRLNTIGDPSSRGTFLELLRKSLEPHSAAFGPLDRRRLQSNPLRLFDSKDEHTQDLLDRFAPRIHEHVSSEDAEHFATVKSGLEALGLPVVHDPKLVRGLDYYTRTTFEIISPHLGAQDALCGGGRYDRLVEDLGGPSVPAVGFAAGIERLLIAAGGELPGQAPPNQVDVYLVSKGDRSTQPAIELAAKLRKSGYVVIMETLRRSIKAQFREANRTGARAVLILGDDEIAAGSVTLKLMDSGHQETISLDRATDILGDYLRPERPVDGG